MEIILASGSPRRKEILEKFKIKYRVVLPNIEEKNNLDIDPRSLSMALAFQKGYQVAKDLEDEIVLSADTLVEFQGRILGKPRDREEAFNSLRLLSGNVHRVITGFSLIRSSSCLKRIDYSETRVKFKELSDDKINRYLDTGEAFDKAGSYGIQGLGQLLVESIEGSYTNVVGLPIEKIGRILEEDFDYRIL